MRASISANHTYSHPSANSVPSWQFGDDVVKGEVIMRPLIEQRGRTLVCVSLPVSPLRNHRGHPSRASWIFSSSGNYRVAPVTVDYADYTFAGVYRSQRLAGKADVAGKIKDAYLDQIGVGFEFGESLGGTVRLRSPADSVDPLQRAQCDDLARTAFARLRARGYAFITLDEAMKDPAYQRTDSFAGPGGSWLSRTATLQGKRLTVTNARCRRGSPSCPRNRGNPPQARSACGPYRGRAAPERLPRVSETSAAFTATAK